MWTKAEDEFPVEEVQNARTPHSFMYESAIAAILSFVVRVGFLVSSFR
jgi:hypothetical protein